MNSFLTIVFSKFDRFSGDCQGRNVFSENYSIPTENLTSNSNEFRICCYMIFTKKRLATKCATKIKFPVRVYEAFCSKERYNLSKIFPATDSFKTPNISSPSKSILSRAALQSVSVSIFYANVPHSFFEKALVFR